MITYEPAKVNSPKIGEGWFAKISKTNPLEKSRLIDRIKERTTVSSADVKAVLDALEYEMIEALSDGHTVRLGDLGSFRPTLSSKMVGTAEEVNASNIKSVRIRFTPSAGMKAAFRLGVGSKVGLLKSATVITDDTVTE